MKTDALLIFIRTPELGKVKTRLAKTIGKKPWPSTTTCFCTP
jgi:glycosyltransferase A (GT-A) superfamily protein (DUF2064 family)